MLFSKLYFRLYKFNNNRIRKFILKFIYRREGGEFYSHTLRRIFKEYHHVDVGLYSHGGCFSASQMDRYTTIGRYCSIARTVRVMNRNHPMNYKSMHAFFFNPKLKYCQKDNVEYIPLQIGNDVWIGHDAIIMPHVRNIGDGAVIGAGAVVNKDVPPYAVVVGNPSRIVRYRFSKEKIDDLIKSKWWDKSIEEIAPDISDYNKIYEELNSETDNP